MSIQILINYFNRILPLDTSEKEFLGEIFTHKTYPRKAFLLQEKEICRDFTFVLNGCLRMYCSDAKGTPRILQFATENWIIADILSFRNQEPSTLNIDALERTEVLQASYENMRKLYQDSPKFNYIFRELLEKHLAHLQRRLLENMSATAQERYHTFVKTFPHLPARISHTQIAYYLGITPEFLSKIRSEK